jgi:choline transporter-like protein 2/4/5
MITTWVFTIFLVPRLKVAVATIQVACDSMKKVPSLMFFPLVGALSISGFMVWWVAVGVFVYSSGKMVRRDCCAAVQASFAELYPGYLSGGPMPRTAPECGDIHCGYEIQMNDSLQKALIYHGFEFLWTTQFIIGFSILTVSQVVLKTYRNAGNPTDWPLPAWPVGRAMYNTCRFYLVRPRACAVARVHRMR